MKRKTQVEKRKDFNAGKPVRNEEFIKSLKSVSIGGRKSKNAKSSRKYWTKRRKFLHSNVDTGTRSKPASIESSENTAWNSSGYPALEEWNIGKTRKQARTSETRSKGHAKTPGQTVTKQKLEKLTEEPVEPTPDEGTLVQNCVPGTTQKLPLEIKRIEAKKRGRENLKSDTVKRKKTKEAEEFYSVERILGRRHVHGVTQYLIKWEGNYENTWEPESNITSDLVEEFLASTSGLKLTDAGFMRIRLKELRVHPTRVEDKRMGGSGFAKGKVLEHVEGTFRMEGEECILGRFQGQAAVLEILKKEDAVTGCVSCVLLHTLGLILLKEKLLNLLRRFTFSGKEIMTGVGESSRKGREKCSSNPGPSFGLLLRSNTTVIASNTQKRQTSSDILQHSEGYIVLRKRKIVRETSQNATPHQKAQLRSKSLKTELGRRKSLLSQAFPSVFHPIEQPTANAETVLQTHWTTHKSKTNIPAGVTKRGRGRGVKRAKIEEDVFFPVAKILDHREAGGVTQYLVQWVGNWENSWEPESNVTQDLVEEFLKGISITANIGINDAAVEPQILHRVSEMQKHVCSKEVRICLTRIEDKRLGGNGFTSGKVLIALEDAFWMTGVECALVRFRGQSVLEILKMEEIANVCTLLCIFFMIGLILAKRYLREHLMNEIENDIMKN